MNRPLNLETDQFARLHGAAHLQVTAGTLWLTIDGEPDDRILERGQSLALPHAARVLVQALGAPARARVDAPPRWWQPLAHVWQAWRAARRSPALVQP